MSATLDPGPVSRAAGRRAGDRIGRPHVPGRDALPRPRGGRPHRGRGGQRRCARRSAQESGSALVFLPGVGEIRRVEERLRGLGANVDVAPLYGDLSPAEQDRAIAPSPAGRRKVVLATSIAETSLTIEGVRIVVDGGLMRVPRFSPRSGMTRLETVRVSQASADQRRGRAGRLEPGVCYRLWTEEAQRGLLPFTPPEILDADLAPLALELAPWGANDAGTLPWLTPPPAAALATARALLLDLGAIDAVGRDHAARPGDGAARPASAARASRAEGPRAGAGQGRRPARGDPGRARLPAPAQGSATSTCAIASTSRLSGKRDGALRLIQESARRLTPRDARDETPDVSMTGALLALAYPDRIGRRRAGRRQTAISCRAAAARRCPRAIRWPTRSSWSWPISTARPRIRASSSPRRSAVDEIEELYADRIVDEEIVQWSEREGVVLARRRRRLGALRARGQAARQARCREAQGRDARRHPPARALRPAVDRRSRQMARARRLPAPAGRELARSVGRGPACLARRPGWRRSSTASRGAITWRGSISTPR